MYDKYVEKVKKIAKIKNKIMKFKYVILAFLAAVIGFSTTYAVGKGNISGNIVANTISYGEELNVSGLKALFSDVLYEYKEQNSDIWSLEVPTSVGKYEVRGKSKKTFNRYDYSNVTSFEILPKVVDVTIINDTSTYGDNLDINVDLANNDQIQDYDICVLNLTDTLASIKIDNLKVVNNNLDVSSNYKFNYVEKSINISNKILNIKANDITHVYDGLPYKGVVELDYNSLWGENINYDFIMPSDYNVGSYNIEINNISATLNNQIINNITFNKQASKLNIVKRDLYIKTSSNSKIYDGNPLEDKTFEVSNLLPNHSIEVVNSTIINECIKTNNYIEVRVLDEFSNDVTSNYNINYQYGTLEIKKADLTIKTGSSTFTYDGSNKSYENYEVIGNLNYELKLQFKSYILVGTYKNEVEILNDIQNYYNITFEFGDIVIEKFITIITPVNVYKEYDGIPVSLKEATGNLCVGDYLEITSDEYVDASRYQVDIKNVTIYNFLGEDVTKNYEIIKNSGIIDISRRTVEIYTFNQEKVYDGLEFIYDKTLYNVVDKGFIGNDSIELSVRFETTPINAGIYNFYLDSYKFNGLEDNYEIILSNNTYLLNILKREVTIKLEDVLDFEYNKEEFIYSNNYAIIDNSLVGNELLEINTIITKDNIETKAINPGLYKISLSNYNIINGLINNYIINCQDIYFNILNRYLEISVLNRTTTYGTPYNYTINDIEITKGNLLEGDILQTNFYSNDTIKDSKDYTIYLDCSLENYEIVTIPGILTVKPFEATLNPNLNYILSNNFGYHIYDGTYIGYTQSFNNYDQIELPYNELIQLNISFSNSKTVNYNIKDADTYNLVLESYYTSNKGLNDSNYIININSLEFKIVPRDIKVLIYDQEISYTGEEFIYDGYQYLADLMSDDLIYVNVDTFKDNINVSAKNAGKYILKITDVTFINGLKSNYNIDITDEKTLTINKQILTISLLQLDNHTYNSEYVTYFDDYNNFNLIDGFINKTEQIKISVKFYDYLNNEVNPINSGIYTYEYYDFEVLNGLKDNYTIKTTGINQFEILKENVTISPIDKFITYGDEFIYNSNEYEIVSGKLYLNEEITITIYDVLDIHAGKYEIRIKSHTFSGNIDNYNINYEIAHLTISKYNLRVELLTGFITHEYDGSTLTYPSHKNNFISETLPYNDQITLAVGFNYENNLIEYAKDAGIYEVVILGYLEEYKDYEIIFDQYQFEITPRNLTIKPFDDSVIYSGNSYLYPSYSYNFELLSGAIVNNELLEITVHYEIYNKTATPIDAGLYDVVVDDIIYTNTLAKNYVIETQKGTLEIGLYKLSVSIITPSETSIYYDALTHNYDSNYNNYVLLSDFDKTKIPNFKLVTSYYCNNVLVDEIKNAGSYLVIVTDVLFEMENKNFIIELINDSYDFEILKYEVSLELSNKTYVYNNQVYYDSLKHEGILPGDAEIWINVNYTINNKIVEAKNANTYKINVIDYYVVLDLENNFNITNNIQDVYLTIEKASINVSLPILSDVTYNGLEYIYNSGYIFDNEFYEEVNYEINLRYEVDGILTQPINANTYLVYLDSYTIDNENYELILSKTPTILNILRVDLVISPSKIDNKYYDGLEIIYDKSYNLISGNLVGNDEFEINLSYTFNVLDQYSLQTNTYNTLNALNAGVYQTHLDNIKFINGLETNYNIKFVETQFEIYKQELLVNQERLQSKVYDSTVYTVLDTYSIIGNLYDEIELYFSFDGLTEAKNVGVYTYTLDSHQTASNLSTNYYVVFEEYQFEIYKLDVVISPVDKTHTYNKEIYQYDGVYQFIENSFYDVDNVLIQLEVEILDELKVVDPIYAGIYTINPININELSGLTQNYNISYIGEATLIINKLDVYVKPFDIVHVYNNQEYVYEYSVNNAESNILDDYMISVDTTNYINVGIYDLIITNIEFRNSDILNSYDITYEIGVLEIIQLDVDIYLFDDIYLYDGLTYSYNLGYELGTTIYHDLEIEVGYFIDNVNTAPINAGIYEIRIISTSLDNIDNYNIIPHSSYLTLKQRDVLVTLDFTNLSKTYDSLEVTYDLYFNNYVSASNLLSGVELMVEVNFYNDLFINARNAGIYQFSAEVIDIKNDLISNYNFEFVGNSLEIKPLEITLSNTYINDFTYNGVIYTYDMYYGNFETTDTLYDELMIEIGYVYNSVESDCLNTGIYETKLINYYTNNLGLNDQNYIVTFIPQQFEVYKYELEISIIDQQKTFDNELFIYEFNYVLPGDDLIDIEVLYYQNARLTEPINAGTYTMYINSYTLLNTLSTNYQVTINDTPKTLIINKLDIVITPITSDVEYGTIKTVKDISYITDVTVYHDFNLLYQIMSNVNIIEAKDAGVYKIIITQVSSIGYENYNVTLNEGTFKINKFDLTIKILNDEVVYDGTPYVFNNNYTLNRTLPFNEEIQIEVNYLSDQLQDEAINANKYQIKLKSHNLNELNYNITVIDGILNILKRDVIVDPIKLESKTYDNQALIYEDYEGNYISATNLLDNVSIILNIRFINTLNSLTKSTKEAYDYGLYEYKLINFEIINDLNSNYNVEITPYQFNILKRDIKISLNSPHTKVYDGIDIYSSSYNSYDIIEGSLAINDQLYLSTSFNNLMSVRDVSTYEHLINSYRLTNDRFDKNFSISSTDQNYNITYDINQFEITPQSLVIDLLDIRLAETSSQILYPSYVNNFTLLSGNIADGDEITISVDYYDLSYNLIDYPTTIGNYYIKYKDFETLNKSNYVISTNQEFYNFIVYEAYIVINPLINNFTYNGIENKPDYDYEIVEAFGVDQTKLDKFIINYHFELDNVAYDTIKHVNTYKIVLDEVIGNEGICKVKQVEKYVTITKQDITIKPIEEVVTYNSTIYTHSNLYEITNGNLYDILEITTNTYLNNALVDAKNSNIYDVVITDYVLDNYTNYNVTLDTSTLTINKANLVVLPENLSYSYTGSPAINNNLTQSLNLGVNDQYEATLAFVNELGEEISPINVGSYRIIIKEIIYDDSNYNIELLEGTLVINPEKLVINILKDLNKTYDGLNVEFNNEFEITEGNFYETNLDLHLLYNNELVAKNVNTYNISLDYYLVDNNISNNYEITILNQTFEIYKKDLYITLNDFDNVTYNNQLYEAYTYVGNYKSINGLVSGEDILVKFDYYQEGILTQPINSGIYDVYISNLSIVENGLLDNYNVIQENNVTLTILNETISVSLANQTFEYNGLNYVYDMANLEITGNYYNDLINFEVVYLLNDVVTTPKNVGNYKMYLSNVSVKNYDVLFDNTLYDLEITALDLEISLVNKFKIYDNLAYNEYLNKDYTLNKEIVDDLLIEVYYSLDVSGLERVEPIDANTYYIHLLSHNLDNNYNITSNYAELVIEKRLVTITPNNIESKVYDGTPITYDVYENNYLEVENLIEGIDITISFNKEIINANTYNLNDVFEVINITNDKLENFTFKFKDVSFTISKRPITVQTGSKTFTYDGLEKNFSEFEIIEGTLVLDHALRISIYNQENGRDGHFYVKDAGVYDNDIIVDFGDNVINSNYEITYSYGKLEILRRNLTINTLSIEYVYNARYQDYNAYEIIDGTLVEGESLDSYSNVNAINVGVYENKLGFEIIDGNINNYNLIISYGYITISTANLTYSFEDVSNNYSGGLHTISYRMLVGMDDLSKRLRNKLEIEFEIYKDGLLQEEIIDSGVYEVRITNVYEVTNGNNISVTLINDSFTYTVNKLEITITSLDGYKLYDGEGLSNTEYKLDGIIASNQEITVKSFTTTTLLNEEVSNVIEIAIIDQNNIDTTNNYIINYVYGTLFITNKLTINLDKTTPYKGVAVNAYNNVDVLDSSNNKIKDAYAKLTLAYKIDGVEVEPIEINTYTLEVLGVEIYRNNELIDSSLLEITYIGNTLEITKIDLKIYAASVEKVYDGLPLETNSMMGDKLLSQHNIFGENIGSITKAGKIANVISSYQIVDEFGNDASKYYNITDIINGTLTVTRRDITIKTESSSKVYDGTALIADGFEVIDGLVLNDRVVLNRSYQGAIYVGEKINNIQFRIYNSNNEDVTSSYYFIKDLYGILTITPAKLTIESASTSKVYDGTPLEDNTFTATGLVNNDVASVKISGTITGVGEVNNTVNDVVVKNTAGKNVTDCYEIEIIEGKLKVTEN